MANAFFSVLFKIIGRLSDILFFPIYALIDNFLPSLSASVENANFFTNNFLDYLVITLKLFMIPSAAIKILVGFSLSFLTVFAAIGLVRFSLNVYNKLKP